ncbi:dTMP kinase [bacterium]|nr:dTMP kinase [bacterium]
MPVMQRGYGTANVKAPDPTRSGALVVLEGIDGCGKSTMARRLVEWFQSNRIEAVFSFEPTLERYGAELRRSFEEGRRLTPEEELKLFEQDRRMHVEQLIGPNMEAGRVVVLDRYYYSSMAYQGVRGVYRPDEVHALMTSFAPVPDVAVFLDIPVETAVQRIMSGRGEVPNVMEKRDNLQRVREAFLAVDLPEWRRIDAAAPPERVFTSLLAVVQDPLERAGLWPVT